MNIFFITIIVVLFSLLVFSVFAMKHQKKYKGDTLSRLNAIPDFTPQKTLVKNERGISIDGDARKICLIVGRINTLKSFEDVIEAQIVIDENIVTKTSRSSQAAGVVVGSVLAGGIGAIIGGLSGKTSSERKIKNVSFKLLINDLSMPVHEISLLELTATGLTPPEVALKEAESWNDLFKVVVFQNRQAANSP